MNSYESIRRSYKPRRIKVLLIAESPPPKPSVQSSRQFYYTDRIRKDDRLYINTVRGIYPAETETIAEAELEENKEAWLNKLKDAGFYMIEALTASQVHEVTKKERQERIKENLPNLIQRVSRLADKNTKLILIKSNVFEVAANHLRDAGFNVLNTELVDYPGRYNQRDYREKLRKLLNI